MEVLVTSARSYDREFLGLANQGRHALHYLEVSLDASTVKLAAGYPAVCCFVDDELNDDVLRDLAKQGTRLIALRATGFNNVDLCAAERYGLTVMRVAQYSPYAVAEFAVGLILALNRRIHRAYNRVREGNMLLEGLLGFDLHGRTVGVIGTGQIGSVFTRIMQGFGCKLLGYDVAPNPHCLEMGMVYGTLQEVFAQADIISLHLPLTPQSHHLIDARTLAWMRPGAMLINTSRGALVDTVALIEALKTHQLGAVGMDVYEEESHLYFRNLSNEILSDDTFARLLTFPNVLVTGHQAFFTQEALAAIARTTLNNLDDFSAGRRNENILGTEKVAEGCAVHPTA
jgi:D-lactate dehydrogenase